MFADIIASPHIPTSQIGSTAAAGPVAKVEQLGYGEEDAFNALTPLAEWNLVQPESLVATTITMDDPVQVHASGFVHMRWLLKKPEYIMGVSGDMFYSSYEMAQEAARVWGNRIEPGFRTRQQMVERVAQYLKAEYDRRVRRHAFYEYLDYGGRHAVLMTRMAADALNKPAVRHHGHASRA